jgi:hypothetical protein
MHAWTRSGRIDQRQSIIGVKFDLVLFKVETLLAAIRAVKWSRRDRQAQIGAPRRDRLATRPTLHTLMSSHRRCFETSKPTFEARSGQINGLSPFLAVQKGLARLSVLCMRRR